MAVVQGSPPCFDSETSPGWKALAVLLRRADLRDAERSTLAQASKSAARIVLAHAQTISLTVSHKHQRGSLFTSQLLDDTSTPLLHCRYRAADLQLTLCAGAELSLTASSRSRVVALTLFDACLTKTEWQTVFQGLADYPRLRALRLLWKDAEPLKAQDTAPQSDSYIQYFFPIQTPIKVPCLELGLCKGEANSAPQRTQAQALLESIAGTLTPRCSTLRTTSSLFSMQSAVMSPRTRCPPFATTPWFTQKLKTCEVFADTPDFFDSCMVPLMTSQSLEHVTITFPGPLMPLKAPTHRLCRLSGPLKTITLFGLTSVHVLAAMPLPLPCSQLVTPTLVIVVGHASLKDCFPAPPRPRWLTTGQHSHNNCDYLFAPIRNTAPALVAAKAAHPTLHVYGLDVESQVPALESILDRLSTDVRCLTIHGESGGAALCKSSLRVLYEHLLRHVDTLCLRLDCTELPPHIVVPTESNELLPFWPKHVKTVCIAVVNNWAPGDECTQQWRAVLAGVAPLVTTAMSERRTPLNLILGNMKAETEDREETISPWLQEEKDAILKWRDEHTGGDERVDLCFV